MKEIHFHIHSSHGVHCGVFILTVGLNEVKMPELHGTVVFRRSVCTPGMSSSTCRGESPAAQACARGHCWAGKSDWSRDQT